MNLLTLSTLFDGLTAALLSVIVLRACPRRDLGRSYAVANLLLALWSFLCVAWRFAPDASHAAFLFRLSMIPAIWLSEAFLYFTYVLLRLDRRRYSIFTVATTVNVLFTFLNFTSLLYPTMTERLPYGFWPQPSFLFLPFLLFWNGLMVWMFVELVLALKRAVGAERKQFQYLLMGLLIGYVGGAVTWLLFYGVLFAPWLNVLIVVYTAIVAYAIVYRQLMDIRIVIRRTIVYSLATAILAGVYISFVTLLTLIFSGFMSSPNRSSSVIATAVIAVLFHPLQVRLQRWVDRRFPRESLDPVFLKEATGRFIHELKLPLAKITLPAELALQELEALEMSGQVNAESVALIKKHLDYIANESVDASRRIEAICDLSHTDFKKTAISVNGILQQGVSAFHALCEKHGIALRSLELDGDARVIGDADQLHVALSNLIRNAFDAVSTFPSINARQITVRADREERFVCIHVQDNGPGVPQTDSKRIFEPFFSGKKSGGMGIGLYLVDQIARRHGGTVEFLNSDGAIFTLRLPTS